LLTTERGIDRRGRFADGVGPGNERIGVDRRVQSSSSDARVTQPSTL
jgi:hypothetical protein